MLRSSGVLGLGIWLGFCAAAIVLLVLIYVLGGLGAPEVQAAVIGAITTVVTATLGAVAVVWQIGSQAGHLREETRHSEGLKLRMEAYREVVTCGSEAGDSVRKLRSVHQVVLLNLHMARAADRGGRQGFVPEDRFLKIADAQTQACESAIGYIEFIEKWYFLVPGIDVFQNAFNSAIYDLTLANRDYSNMAMLLLPIEQNVGGERQTIPWNLPSDAQVEDLESLSQLCQDAMSEIDAYGSDFRVEMQKALLSEHFSHQLPVREPIDPKMQTISLKSRDRLNAYFLSESPWGKWVEAAKRDAEARFVI